MGGEGIAPARVGGEFRRSAIWDRSARGAAGEAGLAPGQQAEFGNRSSGPCHAAIRLGHFIDLERAYGLGRRDFGGGADVEVKFHFNTLFTIDCCTAALIRVRRI